MCCLLLFGCASDDDDNDGTSSGFNDVPALSQQTFTVAEDIDDTFIIGTLEATDPEGDELTFSISEDEDGLFEITTEGELSLLAGKTLDYETSDIHFININVVDGTNEAVATMTINVTQVVVPVTNNAPVIEAQSFNAEKIALDTDVIGTATATDTDGDDLTFSIITNDEDLFEITTDGAISLADGQTLEDKVSTSYTITVEVSDGELTASATITIEVTDPFITMWEVDDSKQLTLPIYGVNLSTITSYNFSVDWGDGTVSEVTSFDDPDATHTYAAAGTYTVTINGLLKGFNLSLSNGSKKALLDVQRWGDVQLGNDGLFFYGCTNLNGFSAKDTPDLSEVTNMSMMFASAPNFNGDISQWDVSNVTNMQFMFLTTDVFNQDISGWDVSNVENMEGMFSYAKSFNQDISGWEVSSVENMQSMFNEAGNFSQDLSGWDTAMVTSCDDFDNESGLTADQLPTAGTCF